MWPLGRNAQVLHKIMADMSWVWGCHGHRAAQGVHVCEAACAHKCLCGK